MYQSTLRRCQSNKTFAKTWVLLPMAVGHFFLELYHSQKWKWPVPRPSAAHTMPGSKKSSHSKVETTVFQSSNSKVEMTVFKSSYSRVETTKFPTFSSRQECLAEFDNSRRELRQTCVPNAVVRSAEDAFLKHDYLNTHTHTHTNTHTDTRTHEHVQHWFGRTERKTDANNAHFVGAHQ